MLPNLGGYQNRLLSKYDLVWVCKVQMLASNTSELTIVRMSGNKSNKGFRPLTTFK